MQKQLQAVKPLSVVLVLVIGALSGCASSKPGGMVVADHRLAAEAGAEMLEQGGNAVDAAVATSFALSVVRPQSCGIGGGGFMVIHLQDDPRFGTIDTAINYREVSPAAIAPKTYEQWNDPDASELGGRAVAVPGTVAGLLYALDKYGTLDRQTVLAPAISLAETGYPADDHHVESARGLRAPFNSDPARKQRFEYLWQHMAHEGELEVGDMIRLPEQAKALRLIAEHGADAFYKGEIAEAIVLSIAQDGGVITFEDLASYEPVEVAPIAYQWRGRTLVVMPPPSSGGIAIAQMFALIDQLDIEIKPTGWHEPETQHLLAEVSKHAFADRSRKLADPRFVDVPVNAMLSPEAINRMAHGIHPDRTYPPSNYGSSPQLVEDAGTSHFSVVDQHGSAVACTETINLAFGSKLAVDGFGFCLNNEMDDFTTISGQANAFGLVQSDKNVPEPGKRPLSSMSPTIILDKTGRVIAVAGASGGPRIISGTAQVLLRIMSGASAAEAVAAPRYHHQWLPDALRLETNDAHAPQPALIKALEAKGHTLDPVGRVSAVQAIRWDPNRNDWDGASDPRKGADGAIRVPASTSP